MSDFRSPGYPDSPEVPSISPVAVPKKKSGNATNLLLIGAAVIAIGGVAFAMGRATAPAAAATGFAGGPGRPTGSFNPGGGFGGTLGGGNASLIISGTVKSIDGTTLTITTADGTDTVVDTSGSTYHAQSPATAADVTAGTKVSVSVAAFGFPGAANGGPGASGAPVASPGARSTSIKATDVTITGAQ